MHKVGIIGMGFIGRMHLGVLRKSGLAEVVAVADRVPENLTGKSAGGGNIAVDDDLQSLDGVETYADGDDLLAQSSANVVLIALPTYLHKEYIIKALAAGKDVICEKPLAMNVEEGQEILDAVSGSDKHLYVAHCIRFWPEYARAKEIIDEASYGRALRAHFVRVGGKPQWSWQGWLLDESKSGGCALDMHIHDIDFANYVFGTPSSVKAFGIRVGTEGVGDIMSVYEYDDGPVVTIEGGWENQATFCFGMVFRVVLEHATLDYNCSRDGKLHIHTSDGQDLVQELSGDGYTCEHEHFFECIDNGVASDIVTPASSVEALRLARVEIGLVK